MGDVEIDDVINNDFNNKRTGHAYNEPTFYMNMENGTTIKMNGHVNSYTFQNGSGDIRSLSGSKMSLQSLQSLRSNASSVNSSTKLHMNGHVSQHSGEYEERDIFIVMDTGDTRFGFSVVGGIDEGFSPRVNEISPGSPAEKGGLFLEDEILMVNNLPMQKASHTEIIMQIHKCKQQIELTVRRSKHHIENGGFHESAIDVPRSYKPKTIGESSSGKSSVDGAPYGMFKFRKQPVATVPLRDSNVPSRDSNVPSRFVNPAYERDVDDEFGSVERLDDHGEDSDKPKSLALSDFVTLLDSMKGKLRNTKQQTDIQLVQQILNTPRFKSAIKTHNRMTRMQAEKKAFEDHRKPVATNSQFLLSEVGLLLMEDPDGVSVMLADIINKPHFKELLRAHDHIAKRETLTAFPEAYDDSGADDNDSEDGSDMDMREEQQVRVVRIDKTNEPLGATVCNEGDAVIISRIIKGGAAEKSGLLHEGDEILEINDNSVRGKDVNEVVELLSELEGTLTFVLVPGQVINTRDNSLRNHDIIVMKALFDYDPTTDDYNPCEEIGMSFIKGDVLEILNQTDPDWWQARFLDEKHNSLAGLIPSKQFQLQRELAKISLKGDDKEPIIKEKKKCFCGRARRKGKKVPMNSRMAPQESEILTYEDMVRIFPDPRKKRPIVLVGPPQVGRREIRQNMISRFPARFSASVPHTTRERKHDEIDGVDYNFVTTASFEKSITASEFIEHGLLEGHYYGTSFSAVRQVVSSGKVCVLNMHCQALPVLKASNLLPYVVFITVPRINELKRLREFDDNGEPFNPHVRLKNHELDELIEKARDLNRVYGHYFDKVIVNSDLDQTFDEILDICNHLETDPQWVPSSWVR